MRIKLSFKRVKSLEMINIGIVFEDYTYFLFESRDGHVLRDKFYFEKRQVKGDGGSIYFTWRQQV